MSLENPGVTGRKLTKFLHVKIDSVDKQSYFMFSELESCCNYGENDRTLASERATLCIVRAIASTSNCVTAGYYTCTLLILLTRLMSLTDPAESFAEVRQCGSFLSVIMSDAM